MHPNNNLRNFFSKSNDFFLIISKDYQKIEMNPALETALGNLSSKTVQQIFKTPEKILLRLEKPLDSNVQQFYLSNGQLVDWSLSFDDNYFYLTGRLAQNSNTIKEEMQSIFDAFPDLGFKMSPEGRYLGYYAGMTPTFIPPEAFMGKKLSEIMPPYIAENQLALLKQCIEKKAIITSQYSLPYPDGLHHFDSKYIPLSDGNCFVIVRNTTDYTRMQELLEESQSRAKIGSWEMNIDTKEVFWTNEIYNIYGLDKQEKDKVYTGLELYEEEDRALIKKNINDIIEHKHTIEHKLQINKADNTKAWINTIGYPVLNADGKVIKVRGTLQDVSESQAIRLELQQNKDTLQLLIKYTPAAVAMFDNDMRYIAYSDRWLSDYNVELEDITGLSHYEVFPDIKGAWKSDHQRVLEGEIYANPEDKWTREDGSVFYLKYVLRPWRDKQGTIGGLIMFTEVITEQVETRLKLEKSVEELLSTNAELEQFAYVASHDLQEPLRMIGNFSQLLNKKYADQLDDKGVTYLGIIFDAAKRMKALIQNLLAYSSNSHQKEILKEVDIKSLLEEKLKDLSLLIDEKRAEIKFQNLPNSISCASNQLGMVFYNLILNAIKFNDKATPVVTISYKKGSDKHIFSVIDNGIGIESHLREKVFKIFQRLHPKKVYSGNGIGLALCKKAVEQMGGEIWHESNESGGSTFSFTIIKY